MSFSQSIGKAGGAIGKGILAGLAGTAVLTLAQMIEMKMEHRKPSTAPAEGAEKVLPIETKNEEQKQKLSQGVHWAYGTSWGIIRGLISLAGIKKMPANIMHFAAVWGTAMVMQPALGIAPPVKDWDKKTIFKGAMFHTIYAAVAGFVYDALTHTKAEERCID